MDLAEFETVASSEAGSFMQLMHPAGTMLLEDTDGKPFGITFVGADSDRARKFVRQSRDRRIKAASVRRNAIQTAAEEEAEGIGMIVACAISWHVKVDGQYPECTPENVRAFMKRFPAWFEQADRFIGDRSNFLKSSPST